LQDSGAGSLRDALNSTPTGGTVDFAPGLIGSVILTSGALNITKSVTVAGPGTAIVTINGNNTQQLFVATTTGLQIAISALHLAKGSAAGDGGAIASASSLALDNCTLQNNQSGGNGGALALGSAGGAYVATITNCSFTGNHATGAGGAVVTNQT